MAAIDSRLSALKRLRRGQRASSILCSAVALAMGFSGCSRNFWRNQADLDAYDAISQKLSDERWAVPRTDLSADQRSRFFDPYNPDCSPLPPDDPSAHTYMHWVDGWQGYKSWHKFGDLMSVENPQWLEQFGITTDAIDPISGEYIAPVPAIEELTLGQAIELTAIHNRDYQTQLENVFQAALNVSQERYDFAVKFVSQPNGSLTANFIPAERQNQTMTGRLGAGLSQTLPAGTQWAVNLANTTMWTFSGAGTTTSASTLGFSIVQPLFQQAGRKVGLETLTQVERDLLYGTRTLARFRKTLFVNVVGGGNGYLSLLRQLQAIRNQQGNITRTEQRLEQLLSTTKQFSVNIGLAALPAGLVADLDTGVINGLPDVIAGKLRYIDGLKRLVWDGNLRQAEAQALRSLSDDPQFRLVVEQIIEEMGRKTETIDILNLQSSLANSVNQLRSSEAQFQDTLDSFKQLMGLPPDMYITIDDTLLKPFELIDPALMDYEQRVTDFVEVVGEVSSDDPDPTVMREAISGLKNLQDEVAQTIPQLVAHDVEAVKAMLPKRIEAMEDATQAQQLREDLARALLAFDSAQEDLNAVAKAIREIEAQAAQDLTPAMRDALTPKLRSLREDLLQSIRNMTVVQASLRVELIEIQPFELEQEEVIALAMENRLDLMNQRAMVMDARRRVEVAANALNGVMSLRVDGSINTPPGGDNPVNFSGRASSISTGLQFTAPTDRLAQRNTYRNAQIAYQRARRDYMLAEDQVKSDVRRAWRQLIVQRRNLETSRRAVRIAALQYDSNVLDQSAPRDPRQVSTTSGLTGQNLLQALQAILNAQNALIQNWVSYEQNRLNIYRDMDIMVIGPDGGLERSLLQRPDE